MIDTMIRSLERQIRSKKWEKTSQIKKSRGSSQTPTINRFMHSWKLLTEYRKLLQIQSGPNYKKTVYSFAEIFLETRSGKFQLVARTGKNKYIINIYKIYSKCVKMAVDLD